jgi:putative membrane protein
MLRTRSRLSSLFVSGLVLVALASCAKKSETVDTAAMDTTAMAPAAPTFTDPQIVAIVVAANDADVANADVAKSKTKSDQVKSFADQMITDHNALNQQGKDLASKLGVSPEETDASRQLKSNQDSMREQLKTMDGAAFDKAYIDNEVAYHQAVVDMVNNSLIPSAQNPELKSLLEQAAPAIQAHLDHAKQLQSTLPAATPQ